MGGTILFGDTILPAVKLYSLTGLVRGSRAEGDNMGMSTW